MIRLRSSRASRLVITRRDDQSSAQFACAGDPRFWLRIETPPADPVILSDFLPGALSEEEQSEVLSFALKELKLTDVVRLLFLDIGPAGSSRAEAEVERILRIVGLYAVRMRRAIAGAEQSPRHGKLDLTVDLHPKRRRWFGQR